MEILHLDLDSTIGKKYKQKMICYKEKRQTLVIGFIGKQPYTKEQVEAKFGEDCTASRNMGYNNYDRVVETEQGQLIPMEKEDIIL